LSLDFLAPGTVYEAEWYEDGVNAPRQAMDYRRKTATVKSGDRVNMKLSRNGGWTGKFVAKEK
ncbi:MAG: glycoside hydrolase family 97 C-terminal domain-containing protein, partial [Duncaniella sp.]|nr:glycoside hydrolase family 97 C-terminal domain-containing protein [Duncaniella sp.]